MMNLTKAEKSNRRRQRWQRKKRSSHHWSRPTYPTLGMNLRNSMQVIPGAHPPLTILTIPVDEDTKQSSVVVSEGVSTNVQSRKTERAMVSKAKRKHLLLLMGN